MDYYQKYLKYKNKYLILKLSQTGGRKVIYQNQGTIYIKFNLIDDRLEKKLDKQNQILKQSGLKKLGDYHLTIMDIYFNLDHPYGKNILKNPDLKNKIYKMVRKHLNTLEMNILKNNDSMQILGLANYFFSIIFSQSKRTSKSLKTFYDSLLNFLIGSKDYEIKKTDMVRIYVDGIELCSFQNFFDYSQEQKFHITVGILSSELIERVNQGEKEMIRVAFINKLTKEDGLLSGYDNYLLTMNNIKPHVRID